MVKKSSAHYQREFRRRLREQGLVKKEVWIRPEHGRLLSQLEKQLRQVEVSNNGRNLKMKDANNVWTTKSLYEALSAVELIEKGEASVELIEGVDPSLLVVMKEYGDLPVFLTVSGEQIIVEAALWPVSAVSDVAGFNEAVLRTHKYFPLSTVCLDKVAGDADYYQMFGALSSASLLSNVVFEIEVLASNVLQATEAYSEFLTIAVEA